MSETAKTKRLKTMLFVWITTGANQYIVKRLRLINMWKRKKNKEKMSKLVAIHFLIYLYIL